jgi:hypothetical protein
MVDAEGNQIIPVSLTHDVAYGKMTVNAPAEFVIDHVVVNLVGSYNNFTYTLNADNVENNTFWFATEPIEVAEFTVTAYDAEGNAVTKSVDVAAAGKTLAFNYGRVSTFSVSGLEAPVVPAFTSASVDDNGYWDCNLTFTSEDLGTLVLNAYYIITYELELPIGTYGFGEYGSFYYQGYSHFTPVGGSKCDLYSGSVDVKVVDGQYSIEFINLADGVGNILIEKAIFVGEIDGLNVPDPRIKLDAPNVTSQITGKTITLSWDPVTGADSYTIEIYSDAETVEPISTTETTFEYTVKSYDSYYSFKVTAVVAEDDAKYRNSGYAGYAEYTDPREQLPAPTNVTATVVGLNVTISWDKVENAVGYEINYYDNGNITKSATETSITLEMSTYNNEYYFYLSSVADENSDSYRSSDDAYITAKTDKDPNGPFADVVATNIIWDSSNGAFKMTGEVVSGTAWGHSSDYIRLYMNEADRAGNNSIKVGQYTGCGGTSPQQGQFGARLSLYWGNVTYPSAVGSASTLDVTYDESIGYTIVLTHNGVTYGYKGMPDGWVAPSEGGDEPDPEPEPEPDPDQPDDVVADGTSIDTAYTFTTYSTYKDAGYPVMCLSGAENGATFNLESNSSSKYPTGFQYFNSGAWYTAVCEYSINGVVQNVDVSKSVTWLEGDNTNGFTVEYIYIVTSDGDGIYYKYDGKFFF